MATDSLDKNQVFDALPPEWPDDFLPEIKAANTLSKRKIIVLDDDPTGTQTVHGLPVLTCWDTETLKNELQKKGPAFFILTNSRGLTVNQALGLSQEIGSNIMQASEQTNVPVMIISRSDSTLRGHFPAEVDEVADALGINEQPYLIFPFFLEGGRFTVNNVHYVAQDDSLIPAAETAYAKDASFGFTQSDLTQWIEEKTQGRIQANEVVCIGLEDIRKGGPDKVYDILMTVEKRGACIVNAVSYRDVEVVVQGLLNAQAAGKDFLFRTAASFVRVMTGTQPKSGFLDKKDLVTGTQNGGLFVVGSYVPKTTAQLSVLLETTNALPVEVDVNQVLDPLKRISVINTVASKVDRAIKSGKDTVLYTSRDLIRSDDPKDSLKIGQIISKSLIRIIEMITCQPRYLVAKGGITSSDVATLSLQVKRAMVKGQVLPGVPVWELGPESIYPGMSYIIFPGNVGEDDALARIQKKLN